MTSCPETSSPKESLAQARKDVITAGLAYFEHWNTQPPFIPGETYIPVTAKKLAARDLELLLEASLDLWLTSGRFSNEFEAKIAKRFGRLCPALFVNSGSSANLLAVSSLGSPMLEKIGMEPLQAGSEIITVAAGFPTTVNPIFQNGWTPVFVDIDLENLNAAPDAILAAITPKTRAVVIAHTLGNPYRADIVEQFCRERGIFLVEDCCDALGSTINGRQVGTFGHFATLSFYPAHHITTGEGGAVIPRDSRFKRIAESIRDWGRDCWCEPGKDNTCGKRYSWTMGDLPAGYDHKYVYSQIGYNLKASDMQAALGVSQLERVDEFIQTRKRNWAALRSGIRSSRVLSENLIPVEATVETDPSWFGFAMHTAPRIDREMLVRTLEERKVATRLLFAGNLVRQPGYKNLNYRIHDKLNNSDEVMKRTFWIGVHPGIDGPRIQYMLEQLESSVIEQLK